MNGASRAVSAWDVHVALNAPGWWDELAARDAEGVPRFAGPFVRPSITEGSVDWDGPMLTPRWLGEDSSQAVAALQPSLYAGQGADEWQRLRAGAAARSEVVLAISMFGTVEPPRNPNPFGSEQSLSLPGSAANGSEYVSGRRISLATKPTIFDQLGGADRDLASRVVTVRDLDELPWWSLHHTGAEMFPPGGGSYTVTPTGSFVPLLITGADEVVAAVWISADESIRHYIVPWLPSWTSLLQWLSSQAIQEFIPSAVRRVHATVADEPQLQTTAEQSARNAVANLESEYRTRHHDLTRLLVDARQAADEVRHDILFGSGRALENAVKRVLADAGCEVTALDELFGGTASADLLVAHDGRHRLVEVKSASGDAGERLVSDARRHLDTWLQLRPDHDVEGITLVVNHQRNTAPLDRAAAAYSRREFVQSLATPVVTTRELFDAWRRDDFAEIRRAVFPEVTKPDSAPQATHTPTAMPTVPTQEAGPSVAGDSRRRRWRRR